MKAASIGEKVLLIIKLIEMTNQYELDLNNMYLIQKCIEGDRRSQNELYDFYYKRMLSYCYKILENREDAIDAVQLGFSRMFKYLPRFKSDYSFNLWLLMIMKYACFGCLNQKKKHGFITPIDGLENTFSSKYKSALDDIYEKSILDQVKLLPKRYRNPFFFMA